MRWANGTDGQHQRRAGWCSGAVVSYSLDNKVAQDRQNEDIWFDPKMSNGSGDTINTYYCTVKCHSGRKYNDSFGININIKLSLLSRANGSISPYTAVVTINSVVLHTTVRGVHYCRSVSYTHLTLPTKA